MSQSFQAIYENGILRLTTPLNLPERAAVVGKLEETDCAQAATDDGLARQQAALNAMFAEVDKLPQVSHSDGLSGRDHDRILYGSTK